MPIEIQWIDKDPATGHRRYLHAEKWARQWQFKWRLHRRAEWTKGLEPTREMWELILDKLQRRHVRREGVSDEDIEQVVRILRDWREPPAIE
jgi:hypothetical protein